MGVEADGLIVVLYRTLVLAKVPVRNTPVVEAPGVLGVALIAMDGLTDLSATFGAGHVIL